jgi:hypothetical protein
MPRKQLVWEVTSVGMSLIAFRLADSQPWETALVVQLGWRPWRIGFDMLNLGF